MAEVNEEILEQTIIDLGVKAEELLQQRQELIDMQTKLNQIRIIKKPQFDPDTGEKTDRTKDVKPKHQLTNVEMTDEERAKIYTSLITDAVSLLDKK